VAVSDLGGRSTAQIIGIAIDVDGRIVAFAQADTDAAAVRFTNTGALDLSFGAGGAAFVTFGQQIYPGAVVLQSDGRIVIAAGANSLDPQSEIRLARFVP
jgi:hypothetical protein